MCVLASLWLLAFVLKPKCAFEALSVHVIYMVYAWALLRIRTLFGGDVCGPSVCVDVCSSSWILLTIIILSIAVSLLPFDAVDAACSNLSPALWLQPGAASFCSI